MGFSVKGVDKKSPVGMDNLEKAVAGIGKSLKNNMPRIVKRNKGDLSFSSAGKPGDMMAAKDEEASNAM